MRIRVRPTWIHDCAQDWLTKQVIDWLLSNEITRDEQLLLHAGVGTSKLPYTQFTFLNRNPELTYQ